MNSSKFTREFPLSWMERHIKNSGMKVVDSKTFTILHSEESAIRQIRVAQSKLPYMSTSVRNGMEPYLLELE